LINNQNNQNNQNNEINENNDLFFVCYHHHENHKLLPSRGEPSTFVDAAGSWDVRLSKF
jgi:hypothetical protein